MPVRYPLYFNGKLEMLIYKSYFLSETHTNAVLKPYCTNTKITQNDK